MKKIQISTDRILLILIVVLLWCTTLQKACESDLPHNPEPTTAMAQTVTFGN